MKRWEAKKLFSKLLPLRKIVTTLETYCRVYFHILSDYKESNKQASFIGSGYGFLFSKTCRSYSFKYRSLAFVEKKRVKLALIHSYYVIINTEFDIINKY